MTSDEDYSEADTTAAEFDAMWDRGEPVETIVHTTTPRATAGAPIRAAITGSTVAAGLSGLDTGSTSSASTITLTILEPWISR